MNRKIRTALLLGAALAVFLLPALNSQALAQDGCQAFHAIMQEKTLSGHPAVTRRHMGWRSLRNVWQ